MTKQAARNWRILIYLLLGMAAYLVLDKKHEEHDKLEDRAPEIIASHWINSPPLTLAGLRGQVVLLKFWTFDCINCQRVEPHVKKWHGKYQSQGLQVIGVHTGEYEHEQDLDNLKAYIKKNNITYAVAVDNSYATWARYKSAGWPTLYLIDKQGVIRHVRKGEGGYGRMEDMIQKLLNE